MVTNLGFHNHSSCSFTDVEQQVLGYGSKFRPTTSLPSKITLTNDIKTFERKIRWHELFHRQQTYRPPLQQKFIPGFHLRSNKQPPKASSATEAALLEFRSELVSKTSAARNIRRKSNLSAAEQRAIEHLNSRKDIVICDADKNLGTAVLNTTDYVAEGARQLADKKYYRVVTHIPPDTDFPIEKFCPEIACIETVLKELVDDHKDLLCPKDIHALFASFPFHPAKFYMLPKLHKPPGPFGPKGRPIVSCINYCTSPASRFVDFHLKSLLNSCDAHSVLKDTNDLTSLLQSSTWPNDAKVVTADVESLYTNMNWADTLHAVKLLLSENNHPLEALLVDLVQFVLENNYFSFDNVVYHQEFGMAMGTPMAVNVANAFLYVSERNTVETFKSSIYLYKRFIDDILMVIASTCNIDEIQNSLYIELLDIKLKWTQPSDTVIFLDLELHKVVLSRDLCQFSFNTYQKPRNAYLYIPFISDHPRANLRAFIKAELIRYNRTNTDLEDILNIRKLFWLRLRCRGYPPQFLTKSFQTVVPSVSQPSSSASKKRNSDCLAFCTTFHPHFLEAHYSSYLKQAFSSNSKLFFRKSKQLFY